jgi:hypothetical protein
MMRSSAARNLVAGTEAATDPATEPPGWKNGAAMQHTPSWKTPSS